jgi:hypothetical protein
VAAAFACPVRLLLLLLLLLCCHITRIATE